jgi:hypothetical protein
VGWFFSVEGLHEQMEAEWQADRSSLRALLRRRPDLMHKQMAVVLKRSSAWVKKGVKRLATAPLDDVENLTSRSRARQTSEPQWDPLVIRRIEQIRQNPPEKLQRTPGPASILSSHPRDEAFQKRGCRLPRSTRTVGIILKPLGLIVARSHTTPQLEPLHRPLDEIQVNCQEVPSVVPDPSGEGKQPHVGEACTFGDAGTSILLAASPHEDDHAQTA